MIQNNMDFCCKIDIYYGIALSCILNEIRKCIWHINDKKIYVGV